MSKAGATGLTTPFKRREFRLLWTGLAVSLLGDGVFLVAVAWQVYEIADRPSALAYVGIAMSLPQVAMLLIGGAVSDRVDRRRILLVSDIVRGLVLAGLAAVTVAGNVQLWELYLAAAVIGIAAAFAAPALDALVPQLVPEHELTQANSVDQFMRPFALQLAGPALGGIAVALFRPGGAFGFDAFTFAFSAWCVWRLAPVGAADRGDEDAPASTLRGDVREGLGYVRRHVWLWGTFVSATITYLLFIGPTQVLLPYIVRNSLRAGATTYGVVLAIGGVGALIGAGLMARRPEVRKPITWMYIWWTIATLAVAGYGIATHAWGLACAAFVINGAEAVGAIVWSTLKQRRVENSMLGRVSSIDWCISTALLPLSYALTPPIVHLLGVRTTLVLAGTIGAVTTIGFLFLPGMRDFDHQPNLRTVQESSESPVG